MYRTLTKGVRAAVSAAAHVSQLRGLSVCHGFAQGPAAFAAFSTSRLVRRDGDSNGQTRGQPTPLFIQLPGDSAAQLLRVEGEYVGDITKAILVEYQQTFKGVDANQLVLMLADDAASTPLDPTLTLTEAGIKARTRLRVEVKAAVAGASSALAPGGQRLPAPGALPYDAALGIPQDVWATMATSAQAAAQSAGQHRAVLAGLPVLQQLLSVVSATVAQQLGIQIIREDEAGNMAVGAFNVPQLRGDITVPPKTFDNLANEPQQVLLLPQRLKCAFEFVDAVANRRKGYGVLLSGPNGVGKSGIGLLSYLLCMARGLPVVYISRCEDWVKTASSKEDGGDEFFLATLWRQNADLIAATPALRTVFSAALRGEDLPFTPDVMRALQLVVAAPDGPRVGVVMDEVQHITKAVAAVNVPNPTLGAQWASRYFTTSWHDWTNSNFVFPRISIASAHGERDFKLPDGEDDRLRIIEPLEPEDTAALQAAPSSPAYIFDPDTRGRIVYMAGNVLRKLVQAASQLPRASKPAESQLKAVRHRLWLSMLKDCSDWLASLPANEQEACARRTQDLLRGELEWDTVKPLYDAGIVYRTEASPLVHPVSVVAGAVILRVMAAYVQSHPVDISLIKDGRIRGLNLEDQLLSFLNPIDKLVPAKLLDGRDGPAVQLSCNYVVYFKRLEEVVPKDVPVLYWPHPKTYPCDGILMPAAADDQGAIILLECSTEDPTEKQRVGKVLKWYRPGPKKPLEGDPVATVLKGRYPTRPLVVALCYDQVLEKAQSALPLATVALSRGEWPGDALVPTDTAPADDEGAGAVASSAPAALLPTATATIDVGNQVRVLDAPCLRTLGLVL